MKETIKATINTTTKTLMKAYNLLTDIMADDRADEYACAKCSEIEDLMDNINNLVHKDLSYFKERIDFAMLLSAVNNDVSLPAINELYEVEQRVDLPIMENGWVDTEMVYNSVEDIVKEEMKSFYEK